MDPNYGQTPLDYLNQIAPQQNKKAPFRFTLRTVILAAIAAIVLIAIIAIVAGAIGNSRKAPWEQLAARLNTTTTIANNSTSLIKNSQLRSLNSSLKLTLTNTSRDLTPPLTKLGINPQKLPDSVVKAENNTGMTDRLEDARLNAKYDSTYAREMSYQLATILSLYQKLYTTSGTQTKATLTAAYNNLQPIQKDLANFSSSTE